MAVVSYRFGEFELDTRAGELRRENEPVPLAPKVFELLLFLLQNPARLISKREILDKVWRDTNVAEGSVTRAITSLRSALNDTASAYVKTTPRRGYSFVATVHKATHLLQASFYEVSGEAGRYPLREGDNVLGRADDCEVTMKLDSISRHHAVITVNGSRSTLRDSSSKNGTFVNGQRIDATVDLHDGDEIRLGSVAITFKLVGRDASTVTSIK